MPTPTEPTAAPAAPANAELVGAQPGPAPKRLDLAIQDTHVDAETAGSLRKAFAGLFDQAEEWAQKAGTIKITDARQVREMKLARETRLALKEIRVNGEKARKALKEDVNRRGKAIDGLYNVLEFLVKPIEDGLLAQEQFVERQEQARKDKLKADRAEQLTALGVDPALYLLGDMTDEQWRDVLQMHKTAAERRAAEAAKAESDRLAKEKADADERERIRLDNERLAREAKEAQERAAAAEKARQEAEDRARQEREALEQKAAQERAEAARQAAEAADKAKREREEIERQAAEERNRAEEARKAAIVAAEAETKRIQAEAEVKAKAEREALEARLAAEQAEKDRVAAEKRRLEEANRRAEEEKAAKKRKEEADAAAAERKRLADQAAADRAAREKAEAEALAAKRAEAARVEAEAERLRKEAAAPDVEKMRQFAANVRALVVPDMKTAEGASAAIEVRSKVSGFADWIDRRRIAAFGEDPKQGSLL